jgi:hypothetical protein
MEYTENVPMRGMRRRWLILRTKEDEMATQEKKAVSVDSFIFELDAEGKTGHFIGSRCKDCGGYMLPRKRICYRCGGDMEVAPLPSTGGKLYSYTVNSLPVPGAVMVPPYAIGQLLLPEGVVLDTVLTDCDFNDLKIGMDLEMVVEKIKEDEEGNDVMAFKHRPVK